LLIICKRFLSVMIPKASSARRFFFAVNTAIAFSLPCRVALSQQPMSPTLPVLSVSGGTFSTQQQVITNTPDTGVALRYTVNGNTPTESDPVVAPGGAVLITQSGTLKVAGFAGATVGPVASASFTITGQVSAGAKSSSVLKSDGTVWTSGDNSYGQLGTGNFNGSSSPIQVRDLSGITAVACGYYHVLALKRDGTVWAWGHNGDGQLGTGTTLNSSASPAQVTILSDVVALAAGGYHSLARWGRLPQSWTEFIRSTLLLG
jgi:hypothetical protein